MATEHRLVIVELVPFDTIGPTFLSHLYSLPPLFKAKTKKSFLTLQLFLPQALSEKP